MQAAAARLREAQLAIVQERVERQVSQLAIFQEDRQAEVQSGHNSGLIRDKWVGWRRWRGAENAVEGRGLQAGTEWPSDAKQLVGTVGGKRKHIVHAKCNITLATWLHLFVSASQDPVSGAAHPSAHVRVGGLVHLLARRIGAPAQVGGG